MAQDKDLDKALKDLYRESWTIKADDFDEGKKEKVVSLVNEYNYERLSDSAKYIYHIYSADICHDKKFKENEKRHIDNAVKLSESSVGILNPEYLLLLMEQGCLLEDTDIDKAISIYQKALLVGQTIIRNPKAQLFPFRFVADTYGNIMSFLAELYDKKGWVTRIEELYKTAFRYRSYYNVKSDPITYGDLYGLSNYYVNKNNVSKSIELLEWIVNDIQESGFYGSPAYVDALYMLGSSYSQDGQDVKALDAYKRAVELARDSLGGKSETLYNLYKNYCVKLAELSQFDELDIVLPTVQQYYMNLDSIRRYADMLFLITDRSINNRKYENANKYCDSLLLYPSYNEGYEEIAYSKKALILFMLNMPDRAQEWQEKALCYCLDHNGENSIIYNNYLSDMAYIYENSSKKEKALTAYLNIIKLLERNNRDTIPFYNDKIIKICELYDADKKYDLEYSFLKERKQIAHDKYGDNTPFYAWICNNLSVFEMNTGKLEEATKNNQIAEKLNIKNEGRNSYNYAVALHNKGRILMLKGKYKQALKTLTESRQIQINVRGTVLEVTEQYIQKIENDLK